MSAKEYIPPFSVLPMPLNEKGEGPETNEALVVTTLYEVWDRANQTVHSFNEQKEADLFCARLNLLAQNRKEPKSPIWLR